MPPRKRKEAPKKRNLVRVVIFRSLSALCLTGSLISFYLLFFPSERGLYGVANTTPETRKNELPVYTGLLTKHKAWHDSGFSIKGSTKVHVYSRATFIPWPDSFTARLNLIEVKVGNFVGQTSYVTGNQNTRHELDFYAIFIPPEQEQYYKPVSNVAILTKPTKIYFRCSDMLWDKYVPVYWSEIPITTDEEKVAINNLLLNAMTPEGKKRLIGEGEDKK